MTISSKIKTGLLRTNDSSTTYGWPSVYDGKINILWLSYVLISSCLLDIYPGNFMFFEFSIKLLNFFLIMLMLKILLMLLRKHIVIIKP